MQPQNTTFHKICSKCCKSKPATIEYFYRNKRAYDGLRTDCKVCHAEAFRIWRSDKIDSLAEYGRAYYAAHKEPLNKRHQIYRKTNQETFRTYLRAWNKANPKRRVAYARTRRALKLASNGKHSPTDIQAQYQAQKGKCYYCATEVGDTFHVDHVIPLSRGGSNDPSNLVIACPPCNRSKSNKLPSEWLQGAPSV